MRCKGDQIIVPGQIFDCFDVRKDGFTIPNALCAPWTTKTIIIRLPPEKKINDIT